jgi:hypothetical protein
MENLVKDVLFSVETDSDNVGFTPANIDRDSLSEIFLDEIDAWARQVLAANGFGDY